MTSIVFGRAPRSAYRTIRARPAALWVYGNSLEEIRGNLIKALPAYLEATMGREKFNSAKVDIDFDQFIRELAEAILTEGARCGQAHLQDQVNEIMQRSTYDQETRDFVCDIIQDIKFKSPRGRMEKMGQAARHLAGKLWAKIRGEPEYEPSPTTGAPRG